MHRSTRHSIARTTLALNRASLTIGSLRSITVADLHVPFFFTFIAQDFSLRAPITVALPIIDKRRAMHRRRVFVRLLRFVPGKGFSTELGPIVSVAFVMPAWIAGIQVRKDASEDVHVTLD